MSDQHPQQELGFWGVCGPSRTDRAVSKCFLTLGVPESLGAPHHSPQVPGWGSASSSRAGCWGSVPTRYQRDLFIQEGEQRCEKGLSWRDLFTQEGEWRCEKGLSGHYLSPGCAKGLWLGFYQLQTFICLRAALPPSGGAAANPSPAAAPSPACPTGKPLAVVVGSTSLRRGVTAAAPSHFVTTREQWWDTELCLCRAWALCPGEGRGLGCLVFHLAGSLGKV